MATIKANLFSPYASMLPCMLTLFDCAAASPISRTPSTVEKRIFNHGDPNLVCTPTKWTDVVVFFFGNYIAHAATIITSPGQDLSMTIFTIISVLLFPTQGVIRGISAVFRLATFAKTDLQTAARARALCMVVRTQKWHPIDGDVVSYAIMQSEEPVTASPDNIRCRLGHVMVYDTPWAAADSLSDVEPHTKVHGSTTAINMPEGYKLSYAPEDVDVTDFKGTISCSYSVVKVLIALGQALYASSTLYLSRGNQITQYGYAAFGLTVAPYAVMSFVNLLGHLITPEYPTLYLVHSPIMDEATRHTGHIFDGAVGSLTVDESVGLSGFTMNRAWRKATLNFKLIEGTELAAEAKIFPPGKLTAHGDEPDASDNTIAMTTYENRMETSPAVEGYRSEEQPRCEMSQNQYDGPIFVPEFPPYKKVLSAASKGEPYEIDNITEYRANMRVEVEATNGATRVSRAQYHVITGLALIISTIPYAIIGGLTSFKSGSSTSLQRGFTMAWLATPMLLLLTRVIDTIRRGNRKRRKESSVGFLKRKIKVSSDKVVLFGVLALVCIFYGAPAVGGAIVVAQELLAYGNCVEI